MKFRTKKEQEGGSGGRGWFVGPVGGERLEADSGLRGRGLRSMAGKIGETGHGRMKAACLKKDIHLGLRLGPEFPARRDSACARLFRGFPGMNRLREAVRIRRSVLRLLDVGWADGWIFPPEPPLLLGRGLGTADAGGSGRGGGGAGGRYLRISCNRMGLRCVLW